MAAPGVTLAFRQIDYAVALRKKEYKNILTDVSGVCKPGRVLAIMGPSGAGKTTLLDVLAGRARGSGEISLTSEAIRRSAAYVQQDDAILASMQVREALQMAAGLSLPGLSPAEYDARVDQLLDTFELRGCAETLIGDPIGRIKGISGGERKRCAVAMCAVREPQLLFLDEPTSGLDAHKAWLLVSLLRKMARSRGATIVCTCHQPSSDLFGMFDDLMLLLGGAVVYAAASQAASSPPTLVFVSQVCRRRHGRHRLLD